MSMAAETIDDIVAQWRAADGADRERLGGLLVERYEKVIRGIVRDEAGDFGVSVRDKRERHTLGTDLLFVIFEAASTYDPARSEGGGFDYWLRYTLRHQLAAIGGIETAVEIPDSWDRVGRIAARVADTLAQQLHRAATVDEIRNGTLAYARQWARDRLIEAGLHDNLDERVTAKLRKQGTLGAIERIEEVLAMRNCSVELDEHTLDTLRQQADSRGLPELFLSVLDDTERFAVERRFGMYDGTEWTFEDIGAATGMAWPDVRRLVAAAVVKPRLPHAHFAYCSGVVVDHELPAADDGSPLERFRGRSSAVALAGCV